MWIVILFLGLLGTALIGCGLYDVFMFSKAAEISRKEPVWLPRTELKVEFFGGAASLIVGCIGGIVMKILGVM